MNKNTLWPLVIVAGLIFWVYNVFNTTQAYQVAYTAIENWPQITLPIGTYGVI